MIFHSYVEFPEGKPPFSHGFLWFSYGFLWFSYGFPMVFGGGKSPIIRPFLVCLAAKVRLHPTKGHSKARHRPAKFLTPHGYILPGHVMSTLLHVCIYRIYSICFLSFSTCIDAHSYTYYRCLYVHAYVYA